MSHEHGHGHGNNEPNIFQKIENEKIGESLSKIKHKLLVMSGKGGVGKSTVAVQLAVTLAASGRKVGLMDVDMHGPTVPVLLGLVGKRPQSEEKLLLPLTWSENLKVLSMGNLLEDENLAVIWRGPMKIGAIRQFLSDVKWGELDYLIIDSPPGTGDEPLTVAQTITDARAIIVTTPQEVSLADVRKSINFCLKVNMPILGVIENMSGAVCPKCGHEFNLFGKGGGEKTAKDFNLAFLGGVPIDPAVVKSGDAGKPMESGDGPAQKAFQRIVQAVEEGLGER